MLRPILLQMDVPAVGASARLEDSVGEKAQVSLRRRAVGAVFTPHAPDNSSCEERRRGDRLAAAVSAGKLDALLNDVRIADSGVVAAALRGAAVDENPSTTSLPTS